MHINILVAVGMSGKEKRKNKKKNDRKTLGNSEED